MTDVCIAFADTDSDWQLAQPGITLRGGNIVHKSFICDGATASQYVNERVNTVQCTFLSFNYYLAEQ